MKARSSLLTVGADSYPAGLFACSTLSHCGQRALIAPSTWMTAPSVATPRSANKLRKAKPLSGTASASKPGSVLASSQLSETSRRALDLDNISPLTGLRDAHRANLALHRARNGF